MKILITGCGRSGTGYMAKLFQAAGLDVGHEKEGLQGTSDWHAIGWPIAKLMQYDHIIHVWRDPLLCMRSLPDIKDHSWKYISNHIPVIAEEESTTIRAMYYWAIWNMWSYQLVQRYPRSFSVNVTEAGESAPLVWLLQQYGDGIKGAFETVSQSYNTRGPYDQEVTWKQLREVHKELTGRMVVVRQILMGTEDADRAAAIF